MIFEELFHIDPKNASKRFGSVTYRRLKDALDDFNAVLSGNPPVHAKVDKDHPLITDGGTTFYIGDGYKLTIFNEPEWYHERQRVYPRIHLWTNDYL